MKDIALIQTRLEGYHPSNDEEEVNAIREILQEMILAALSRTDFFTKAAFHGGTQLRIFEHIRRYSEDLDFALKQTDLNFDLGVYLEKIAEEMRAMGVELEVKDKSTVSLAVKKGFLKNDSLVKLLEVKYIGRRGSAGSPGKLRIKMEVDANPPTAATYAASSLLFPFPASVVCFDRNSSFAGKMHALLCRQYIKGRDWFDFIWYRSVGAKLNHQLLSAAIDQQGPWAGKHIVTDDAWVKRELSEVINRMDFAVARKDVLPFVYPSDRPSLDLWSRDYFLSLV